MIKLHHLNYSRSFRVLWLLEELAMPYELVAYKRDANFRAPPELKAVHPIGKAPVIQDGALTLAESAAILRYIDEHHVGDNYSPEAGSTDAAIHDEWLQYSESSAAFPIMMTLLGGRMGGLPDGLARFTAPEVRKALDYIRDGIGEGPYLMGPNLTLADIQLSYILEIARNAGLLQDYPAIIAYLQRLSERPAYARAIETGGPMMPVRGPAKEPAGA